MRPLILAQEHIGGLRVLPGRLEDMPGSASDYWWHKNLEPHRAHIIEVRKEGARVQLGLLLMN